MRGLRVHTFDELGGGVRFAAGKREPLQQSPAHGLGGGSGAGGCTWTGGKVVRRHVSHGG